MIETPPIPSVLVFLLCDQVINEAGTSKKSLIGLFDDIIVSALPARHPSLWVFVRLADAQGEYSFRIEIVKLESDKPLGRIVVPKMSILDRIKNTDFMVRVPEMPIPEVGVYEFQLYANEVWIGRTALTVRPVQGGAK